MACLLCATVATACAFDQGGIELGEDRDGLVLDGASLPPDSPGHDASPDAETDGSWAPRECRSVELSARAISPTEYDDAEETFAPRQITFALPHHFTAKMKGIETVCSFLVIDDVTCVYRTNSYLLVSLRSAFVYAGCFADLEPTTSSCASQEGRERLPAYEIGQPVTATTLRLRVDGAVDREIRATLTLPDACIE